MKMALTRLSCQRAPLRLNPCEKDAYANPVKAETKRPILSAAGQLDGCNRGGDGPSVGEPGH